MAVPLKEFLSANDFISLAGNIVAIFGVLGAAYFFILRREFYPRAQFDLSMRLLGERNDELLLELEATVKNIGLVRHSIRRFTFSLRGLDAGSPWEKNTSKLDLIDLPRGLQNGDWVPADQTTIIEPGTEQRFVFTMKIAPADVEYLRLSAEITYKAWWVEPHFAVINRSIAELKKQLADSTEFPQRSEAR